MAFAKDPAVRSAGGIFLGRQHGCRNLFGNWRKGLGVAQPFALESDVTAA